MPGPIRHVLGSCPKFVLAAALALCCLPAAAQDYTAYAEKQIDSGVDIYDKALKKRQNVANAMVKALAYFDKAAEHMPDRDSVHLWRARCLKEMREYDGPKGALAAIDAAIRLRPGDGYAHDMRGYILTQMGRFEEAVGAYDRALKLEPDKKGVLYWKAKCVARLGRHEEALALAKVVLKDDPKSKRTKNLCDMLELWVNPKEHMPVAQPTNHYVIHAENNDHVRKAAKALEMGYRAFEQAFPGRMQKLEAKLPVFLFSTKKRYLEVTGAHGSVGSFMSQTGGLYAHTESEHFVAILKHEAYHQLHARDVPAAIPWFDEGFGYTFEVKKWQGPAGARVPVASASRMGYIKESVLARGHKLENLLKMPSSEFYEKELPNSDRAMGFLIFLASSENEAHRKLIPRYQRAIASGKGLISAYEAVFGDQNVNQLEREWKAWFSKVPG